MSKIIYSCEEHVYKAMDELITYEETFPNLEKCNNSENKCNYCDCKSIYLVK